MFKSLRLLSLAQLMAFITWRIGYLHKAGFFIRAVRWFLRGRGKEEEGRRCRHPTSASADAVKLLIPAGKLVLSPASIGTKPRD